MNKQSIVLGGGCFWCTEAIFKEFKGVISVQSGYAGGTTLRDASGQAQNPTYEEICSGTTGHAEVIKIDYDADIISLETLLTVFFATHDPTTKDRQGNDVGTQYRSIVLCPDRKAIEDPRIPIENRDRDDKICEHFIKDLNSSSDLGAPITTEVKLLDVFYPAEEYHQNYYQENKTQPYCQVVINPKLAKVRDTFRDLMKEFSNENNKN